MKRKVRYKRRKKRNVFCWFLAVLAGMVLTGAGVLAVMILLKRAAWPSPEELLIRYMDHIQRQEYEEMYAMINPEASGNVSPEDFIKRNSAIYEGIEAQNVEPQILL